MRNGVCPFQRLRSRSAVGLSACTLLCYRTRGRMLNPSSSVMANRCKGSLSSSHKFSAFVFLLTGSSETLTFAYYKFPARQESAFHSGDGRSMIQESRTALLASNSDAHMGDINSNYKILYESIVKLSKRSFTFS